MQKNKIKMRLRKMVINATSPHRNLQTFALEREYFSFSRIRYFIYLLCRPMQPLYLHRSNRYWFPVDRKKRTGCCFSSAWPVPTASHRYEEISITENTNCEENAYGIRICAHAPLNSEKCTMNRPIFRPTWLWSEQVILDVVFIFWHSRVAFRLKNPGVKGSRQDGAARP